MGRGSAGGNTSTMPPRRLNSPGDNTVETLSLSQTYHASSSWSRLTACVLHSARGCPAERRAWAKCGTSASRRGDDDGRALAHLPEVLLHPPGGSPHPPGGSQPPEGIVKRASTCSLSRPLTRPWAAHRTGQTAREAQQPIGCGEASRRAGTRTAPARDRASRRSPGEARVRESVLCEWKSNTIVGAAQTGTRATLSSATTAHPPLRVRRTRRQLLKRRLLAQQGNRPERLMDSLNVPWSEKVKTVMSDGSTAPHV